MGPVGPLACADWFRGKETRGEQRKPAVLLVDDSPFFRNMLAPVLQAAGYRVTAAVGGREALDLIAAGNMFDIVITDIDMPEMDGYALAEKLRGTERSANLPIVGLSSTASVEGVQRGRDAGFYDIVAKFDRQGLIAAINEQTQVGQAA